MHQEVVQKEINPINGFITLFIGLVGMIGSIFLFVWGCIMAAEETNVGLGVTFIIGGVILRVEERLREEAARRLEIVAVAVTRVLALLLL